MPPADRHQQDISALRDRLTRLSQARLNINESLDRDHVFRKALSSARSLTRVTVPSALAAPSRVPGSGVRVRRLAKR